MKRVKSSLLTVTRDIHTSKNYEEDSNGNWLRRVQGHKHELLAYPVRVVTDQTLTRFGTGGQPKMWNGGDRRK